MQFRSRNRGSIPLPVSKKKNSNYGNLFSRKWYNSFEERKCEKVCG
uniref:Uncharacterized protein n=1 Tax=Myoviridae sp. ctNQV2 TaxID=2827683 RepID=A0A8S5RZW5_9CAUD|nr:MAG TPA: hypothetical protein [Myoviridae sp. ctNQV2]